MMMAHPNGAGVPMMTSSLSRASFLTAQNRSTGFAAIGKPMPCA